MNLILIFKDFMKNPLRALAKIGFLGLGFAVAIVLITKVFFEQSYDTFYSEGEKVYQIQSKLIREGKLDIYGKVAGGVAPLLAEMIPGVEVATRITGLATSVIKTKDDKKVKADISMADENYFDLLPLPMIEGDAKETLSRPDYALISASIAEKLGGDVIGKQFMIESRPDVWLTIGGVFEDKPVNTHNHYDVLVSLVSISKFMWDGRDNLMGNDRYLGYIKINENVDITAFRELSNKTIKEHPFIISAAEQGYDVSFEYLPLTMIYEKDPNIKRLVIFLIIISALVLFAVVMNYILLLFSDMTTRSKKIAIYKCYGASRFKIIGHIILESLIYVLLSIFLAILILLSARGGIENLLAIPFDTIFNPLSTLVLGLVFSLIVFLTGYLPGYIFAKIPVQQAFLNYRLRYGWKKYFLSFQFFTTAVLMVLLVVINMQYKLMLTDEPGYEYENLAYVSLAGVKTDDRLSILNDVKNLSEADMVTTISSLPFVGHSGNNIYLPNDRTELFNIADQYRVGHEYFELMEVPIIEGANFNKDLSPSNEVIISRSFLKAISKYVNWSDGAIGKKIGITEHGDNFVITGVYEDYRLGTILNQDNRPSVIFCNSSPNSTLLIKFHKINQKSMDAVSTVLRKHIPNRDLEVNSYKLSMLSSYEESKNHKNMIIIASLIALMVSLFGLIVYLQDEINYRRLEIAMRKINGAEIKDVISLFVKNIMFLSLPSLVIGGALAYYVSLEWLKQFSEKTPLSWYIFFIIGLVLIGIIIGFVILSCYRISKENPSKSLRN